MSDDPPDDNQCNSESNIAFMANQIGEFTLSQLNTSGPNTNHSLLATEFQIGFLQVFSMYKAKYSGRPIRSKIQKKLLITLELAFCGAAILIHFPKISLKDTRPFIQDLNGDLSPKQFADFVLDALLEFYSAVETKQSRINERIEMISKFKNIDIDERNITSIRNGHTFSSSEGVWLIRPGFSIPMPLYRLKRDEEGSECGYVYNLDNDPLFEMPNYNTFLNGIIKLDAQNFKAD